MKGTFTGDDCIPVTVSVDVPEVPRTILEALSEEVIPGEVTARVTVPVKLFNAVTVIVAVAERSTKVVTLEGLKDTL
jgi:hypothetical protein